MEENKRTSKINIKIIKSEKVFVASKKKGGGYILSVPLSSFCRQSKVLTKSVHFNIPRQGPRATITQIEFVANKFSAHCWQVAKSKTKSFVEILPPNIAVTKGTYSRPQEQPPYSPRE